MIVVTPLLALATVWFVGFVGCMSFLVADRLDFAEPMYGMVTIVAFFWPLFVIQVLLARYADIYMGDVCVGIWSGLQQGLCSHENTVTKNGYQKCEDCDKVWL